MKLITNFCILYLLFPAVASPLPDPSPALEGEEWDKAAFWEAATVEAVADCLEAGTDINLRNKDGFSLLHLAARSNDNPAVITALSKAGADINSRDQGNNIPLRGGGSNKNSASPQFPVFSNTDLSDLGRDTPLHLAAQSNPNPAVITALMEAGADINLRSIGGYYILGPGVGVNLCASQATPLHLAAGSNDNPSVITALLEAGADINSRDKTGDQGGNTPLHLAAMFSNNPAIITALLEAGADINSGYRRGNTPLHSAAMRNDNPAVITALLDAGADINSRDRSGMTPLHRAVMLNHHLPVITALLDAGANINSRTQGGRSLGSRRVYLKDNPEVITQQIRDQGGSTPLHLAAMVNHNPAFITSLLDAGADINSRDQGGNTPLHLAAMVNRNPAVITALLEAGADPKAKNEDNETAWDYAKKNKVLMETEGSWRLLLQGE